MTVRIFNAAIFGERPTAAQSNAWARLDQSGYTWG